MAVTFAELGRVEAIRQLFEGSPYTPFQEPLRFLPGAGDTSVSASRMLLEGTDFDLVYFPLKHLGYKSVIAVTGELYASLARPRSLCVTLGISAKLDYGHIRELWDGVLVAAKEHGYESLGLDLVPSRNGLAISLAASGVRSSGMSSWPEPRTKDLICVCGSLGAAYLGQQVLEHKSSELEKYKAFVGAYLKPELGAGAVSLFEDAAVTPSCGCFVTRGLADAVLRISESSGLGAKIYAEKIPFEGNSFSLGKEMDIDPVSAAMNGGDDYRLLFTLPIAEYGRFRADLQVFDIIGHLALPEVGAVLVTPDGLEHGLSSQGWR